MMTFIKTHLISLLSGLGALIFVAVGVLGMMSDTVVSKMTERASRAGVINQLRSSAKNQAWIEAEAERGQLFEKEYNDTREVARRISARRPLMDGIFPVVEQEHMAFEFRDAYAAAMRELPRGKLMGGDRPGAREIADAQADIEEIRSRELEEEEGGTTEPPIGAPGGGGGTGAPAPVVGGMGGLGGGPSIGGGPGGGLGGMFAGGPGGVRGGGGGAGGSYTGGRELGDPKTDASARAAITTARNIRCYIGTDPTSSSLHLSPILNPTTKPDPAQMWYAQVGLWVQQDIINAISELNDEAASRLAEDEAYVENMPVKRLQAVQVLGYWTAKNGQVRFDAAVGSGYGSSAIGLLEDSFTGRKSDDEFDVIRFQVLAVVDQRDLTKLIDAITRQNFYKLIDMTLTALEPNADVGEGYLYGSAPVARVDLDFEGYMARSVYEPLFPKEVRVALGLDEQQ